jgi:hypothetical protein
MGSCLGCQAQQRQQQHEGSSSMKAAATAVCRAGARLTALHVVIRHFQQLVSASHMSLHALHPLQQ